MLPIESDGTIKPKVVWKYWWIFSGSPLLSTGINKWSIPWEKEEYCSWCPTSEGSYGNHSCRISPRCTTAYCLSSKILILQILAGFFVCFHEFQIREKYDTYTGSHCEPGTLLGEAKERMFVGWVRHNYCSIADIVDLPPAGTDKTKEKIGSK